MDLALCAAGYRIPRTAANTLLSEILLTAMYLVSLGLNQKNIKKNSTKQTNVFE